MSIPKHISVVSIFNDYFSLLGWLENNEPLYRVFLICLNSAVTLSSCHSFESCFCFTPHLHKLHVILPNLFLYLSWGYFMKNFLRPFSSHIFYKHSETFTEGPHLCVRYFPYWWPFKAYLLFFYNLCIFLFLLVFSSAI